EVMNKFNFIGPPPFIFQLANMISGSFEIHQTQKREAVACGLAAASPTYKRALVTWLSGREGTITPIARFPM
ncbi:MAG: hypothetical protein WBV43_03440, partial [Pseudolabrys sp.]